MAEEIGVAYLSVKPKMSGDFSSELEGAGKKSGGRFGGAFSVAAGNLISGAVEKLGSAVGETFKKAFDNYANYEQLVGGVDTLFKESSAIVQKNAAQAFKTAGMSANEYMENVTSFSASLLQSLGGDTNKAASYADRAMRDMSDNANKMGTDMGRITDAYQGFAKDNYTMLDNLKLGYGGTKTEMQRLIKDAASMTDVQKKLGVTVDESSMSFGNVVNAISVMQESMGIAGTTAKEGSETISGSIGKLQAAWDNFLTGVFDDKADMGALGEQLFESIGDVIRNIAPRIMTLAQRVIFELPGALISALQSIPSILEPTITSVFGNVVGGQITGAMNDAIGGFTTKLQELADAIVPVVTQIYEALQPLISLVGDVVLTVLPLLQQALGIVVDFITQNVLPFIGQLAEAITPVIETIANDVREKLPEMQQIISDVMTTIQDIIQTVWPFIESIVIPIVQAIGQVIQFVWPIVSEIIMTAMRVIRDIITTVWPIVKNIIVQATGAIKQFTEETWPKISGFVQEASQKIESAINGFNTLVAVVQYVFGEIQKAIEDPLGTAQRFIEEFVNTITGIFNGLDLHLPDIALPHFNVYGGEFPWGVGGQGAPPDFSVDWYGSGGFADSPTLNGYGERGLEFYWPGYSPYFDKYASAIAEHMPQGAGGVDIHDCTFNVRQESDIRRVAEELNTLINRQTAGAI